MNRALLLALTAVIPLATASGQSNASLQVAVNRALHPSAFKDIHASVLNGAVTLTGSVGVYSTRLDAEVEVSRVPGITSIQDRIQVAGPAVPDAILQAKLKDQIAYNTYERVHELPVRSQAISVNVHNGVVRLSAQKADPLFASIAFSTAANTPGVRAIVNSVTVKQFSTARLAQEPVYTVSSVP